MQLLEHLTQRDSEIDRLSSIIQKLKNEEDFYIYKPLVTDPVDLKLANYINKAPIHVRKNMNFQRESEGVYKYHRKRVFMKIEGDTIVIRVGGGYLTMDEFV